MSSKFERLAVRRLPPVGTGYRRAMAAPTMTSSRLWFIFESNSEFWSSRSERCSPHNACFANIVFVSTKTGLYPIWILVFLDGHLSMVTFWGCEYYPPPPLGLPNWVQQPLWGCRVPFVGTRYAISAKEEKPMANTQLGLRPRLICTTIDPSLLSQRCVCYTVSSCFALSMCSMSHVAWLGLSLLSLLSVLGLSLSVLALLLLFVLSLLGFLFLTSSASMRARLLRRRRPRIGFSSCDKAQLRGSNPHRWLALGSLIILLSSRAFKLAV